MTHLLADLRFAVRSLRRSPGFFVVTVLALALGIGATTSIFSVVYGVLLRPLPYPEPERIVEMSQVNPRGGRSDFSDANFQDLRAQTKSFAALAEFTDAGIVSVSGSREAVRARAAVVSSDFFSVLGVTPLRGRLFAPDEQREGGTPAVLVSQAFWQRHLGSDPAALSGRTLSFEGRTYTIVGVMPASVDVPLGTDLWTPRELERTPPSRTAHNWSVLGRIAPGVSLQRARVDASTVAKQLRAQYGDATWMVDVSMTPLREQMVGESRRVLVILLAASGVLLLIACANVVNLMVARMAARQSELAVRVALGAGRRRLAQQFLAESLALTTVGAVLGIAIAALGVRALLALEPGNLPRVREIGVTLPVLGFAIAVSGLTAVALGLITAWRALRGDVREALAQAQRTQAGAGASYRVRGTLVVAQVAMTLVLLVGAGLLARSFVRLLSVEPGFRTQQTVVLDLSLAPPRDSVDTRRMTRLYEDLIARLRALPGVTGAGGVNGMPLALEGAGNGTFAIMSRIDEQIREQDFPAIMKDPSRSGQAEFRVASGGYFAAMGIPVVRGRVFDERDTPSAPHVAVISASLAKAEWPGEEPIGKIIQFGNMDGDVTPFTIVGIVGDVRERSLATEPRPTFYADFRQRPRRTSAFNLVMHGTGDVSATAAAAGRVLRQMRPDVPPRVRTIESVVSQSVADRRFVLVLVGVFGGAALLLATLGVYGVISFLVAQRQQELAVRVALGATGGDVLRLVLRQGVTLALAGVAVGAVVALAVARLLSGLLYGVGTADPVAFGGVSVLLAAVALLASWVPARRASRVDPMRILRGG